VTKKILCKQYVAIGIRSQFEADLPSAFLIILGLKGLYVFEQVRKASVVAEDLASLKWIYYHRFFILQSQ